ncbi:hypothetical protein IRJ41_007414 [Triplophysa rosa]|uniref:Uncharacterized protein n=1 Tax=Triplophysa rosa TaxID=992332 RepID=A0A9W7TR94_TRIRA|nr:hypothetical protein IRJ41_007414 [Triplophysa rosa]
MLKIGRFWRKGLMSSRHRIDCGDLFSVPCVALEVEWLIEKTSYACQEKELEKPTAVSHDVNTVTSEALHPQNFGSPQHYIGELAALPRGTHDMTVLRRCEKNKLAAVSCGLLADKKRTQERQHSSACSPGLRKCDRLSR